MIITWKHLSEISSNIFAGGTPDTKREDFYGGDIPWLRSGEIDFNVIKSAEKNITQLGYENSSARWIKPKSVIMAMTGATVAKCATLEIESTANQSVCAIEPSEELNYKFLYYYLASKYVSIKGMAQGVLTSLNLQLIKRIEIPVPPIKEQKEIVVKLDVFTSLISKLDEEIELRKKQLESYLNTVFGANLKEAEERAAGNVLELKTLSELGTFTRGKRFVREDVVESGVPCIHYGDMYTYYGLWATQTKTFITEEKAKNLRFARKDDVVIVGAGENDWDIGVGLAWLGEEDAAVHDACYILQHQQNPKYISYFLRSGNYHLQIRGSVSSGKICSISARDLGKAKILISKDVNEQNAIVEKLDAFTTLISKLEEERDLRQKQYEYYREKLLTFE